MARTVNLTEHAARRDEILDAAQRLILSTGYERMTVQDILDDRQISKGAFNRVVRASITAGLESK